MPWIQSTPSIPALPFEMIEHIYRFSDIDTKCNIIKAFYPTVFLPNKVDIDPHICKHMSFTTTFHVHRVALIDALKLLFSEVNTEVNSNQDIGH